MVSKHLEKPIQEIAAISQGKLTSSKIPAYRLDSSHDLQIANILEAIDPAYAFVYLPYASNLYFELHKDEVRAKKGHHKSPYFVRTLYNGKSLPF